MEQKQRKKMYSVKITQTFHIEEGKFRNKTALGAPQLKNSEYETIYQH